MQKEELFNYLKNRKLFWSYDVGEYNSKYDSLIIEHILLYGDVNELNSLFSLFTFSMIKDIWLRKVITDKRYYKLNYYLAVIYFNIKSPKSYILRKAKENSRYERIKHFAKTNTLSIN
ncbi:MAG: hypothetical protein ISR55_05740 [Bacteroidetes bacterium]|nr:hypothetical protein [Bacteroidota bacterium]